MHKSCLSTRVFLIVVTLVAVVVAVAFAVIVADVVVAATVVATTGAVAVVDVVVAVVVATAVVCDGEGDFFSCCCQGYKSLTCFSTSHSLFQDTQS